MKKTFLLLSFLLITIIISSKAQPVLVKAIPRASTLFFKANGTLYFFSGDTLWKSGGTSATTVMVKKLGEGLEQNPVASIVWNNKFYFTTRQGNTASLWKSDGTYANTVKIASYDFVRILTVYDNNLILTMGPSDDASLWKMNAADQFTHIINLPYVIQRTAVSNGKLYFIASGYYERDALYVTDGTFGGTHLVYDAYDEDLGYFRSLSILNDSLYAVISVALGESPDIFTKANESGVTHIWTSSNRGLPTDYTNIEYVIEKDGKLSLFTKDNDELWEYDPLTNKVSNIAAWLNTDRNIFPYYLSPVVAEDSILLFNTGGKLYRSTGPNQKTYSIGNIYHKNNPKLTVVGNKVFYVNHASATPSTYAQELELYQSGLQKENTKPVRSLFSAGEYGHADNLIELNGKLYFTTQEASGNLSLWIYDPEKPSASVPYFTMVDADTDQDLQWIKEGDTIIKNLNKNVSIRYNPVGNPGSVKFKLGTNTVRTENSQPFSLAGDNNGNYAPWTGAIPGTYQLSGIPYSLSGGNGTAGSTLITNFVIKSPSPKIPPLVNAGPDLEITIPLDSVQIFASSSDPDGQIIKRDWFLYSSPDENAWTFGNGDTIKIWFGDPGLYTFIYSVRDNDNLTARDTLVVKVNDARAKVKGFILVNADTDTDIKEIGYYEELDLSTLPPHLTIRVKTEPENLDKVTLINDGITVRTETVAPYSLFGDSNGNFAPGNFSEGTHYMSAIPYLDNIENPWGYLPYRIKRSIPGPLLNFVLVDATTDTDITALGDGGHLWLETLPENLNIRVETNGSPVGSVKIKYDTGLRSENVAPYSLYGDNNGNFNAGNFTNGEHTLEAIAYSGPNGSGNYLNGIFIHFYVIGTSGVRIDAFPTNTPEFEVSPNPSSSVFQLNLYNKESDFVSIEISRADGTKIKKLYDGFLTEDSNTNLHWDASGYAAGVYFCTIKKSSDSKVYRLVVVK